MAFIYSGQGHVLARSFGDCVGTVETTVDYPALVHENTDSDCKHLPENGRICHGDSSEAHPEAGKPL